MAPRRRIPSTPPPVRRLTDEALLDVLEGLTRQAPRSATEERRTVSAVADVELELARRGVRPARAVQEPTPIALATQRFTSALARGDAADAERFLEHMDVRALWTAWQRLGARAGGAARLLLLGRILFHLDRCILGEAAALSRARLIAASGAGREELEAYVEQCIAFHFGTVAPDWDPPPA